MTFKLSLAACALLLLASCGGGVNNVGMRGSNTREVLTVQPAMANAIHGAMPPQNAVMFTAFDNPNCPMMGQCMMGNPAMATWTSSDMTNTTVMNNSNGTGTVTCINATPMMVVVTATANSMTMTGGKVSASANLMCQ